MAATNLSKVDYEPRAISDLALLKFVITVSHASIK